MTTKESKKLLQQLQKAEPGSLFQLLMDLISAGFHGMNQAYINKRLRTYLKENKLK